jgi:serine-type D-Ala-D-Ala endopeptidase (penicillin-binding protein 7)
MNPFVKSVSTASRLAAAAALIGALTLVFSTSAFAKPAEKPAKPGSQKSASKAGTPTGTPKKPVLAKAQKTRAGEAKHAARTGKSAVKVSHASSRKATDKLAAQQQRLAKGKSTASMTKVAIRASAPQASVMRMAPAPMSSAARLGLRDSNDPLDLGSSVALVMDQETNEILFRKNDQAVLPIASLTKLMTGLVIADANLPMDDMITITRDDVDMHKGSSSRLAVGTMLSRGELMHLSLMSSENRAANALGRTYPGGMQHFVALMNAKARSLGMMDTRYVEPTGLMSQNQSSARDLAILVNAAYERPILRSLSTSPGHQVELGQRVLQYNNSNRLVHNPHWDIGLQKTGYISEAGRCLVMQARVAGRKLIMVFLDSSGKFTRLEDAERVRRWVEAQSGPGLQHVARPQG